MFSKTLFESARSALTSSRTGTLLAGILLAALLLSSSALWSHVPHDVIHVLAVSPEQETDGLAFTVLHNARLRSTDSGGSWMSFGADLPLSFRITAIEFSPRFADNGSIYLTSAGDGVFLSQDKGVHWRSLQGDLPDQRLAAIEPVINPDGEDVLYVSGVDGGLYRSADLGATWSPLLDRRLKVVDMTSDPAAPGRFVVLTEDGKLRSTLEGVDWQVVSLSTAEPATAVVVARARDGVETLLVGTESGLLLSRDAGETWQSSDGSSFAGQHVTSLVAASSGTVYATTWEEAGFVSADGGASWQQFDEGLETHEQAVMVGFPQFREVVVTPRGTAWIAAYTGLYRAAVSGRSWEELRTYRLEAVQTVALSPEFASDGRAVLATDHAGVYFSEDHGDSWRPIHMGLNRTNLSAVTFRSQGGLYATTNDAFFSTPEVETSWQRTGLEDATLGWLARFNPLRDPPKREAFPIGIVESPEFASDETIWLPTRRLGVLRSEDGGDSWWQLWPEQARYLDDLVPSPDYARDRALYAAVRGRGLYRSTNRGESWEPLTSELAPFIHLGRDSRENVQLAISPALATDRTIYLGTTSGLFRSFDAGVSWLPVDGIDLPVHALAISPQFATDGVILVSVDGDGLFRSDDHGASFRPAVTELGAQEIFEGIFFSPSFGTDQTVFATSMESLYRSSDGGYSWQQRPIDYRYENHDSVITYDGPWLRRDGAQMSAGSCALAESKATATLQFVGTGVRWLGSKSPTHGRARVKVDDGAWQTIDLKSSEEEWLQELFSTRGLAEGAHRLWVEALGGGAVAIDAFDVSP